MKNTVLLFIIILFISCGNEKELQLPQIDKAEITELQDVSAAYLFYDETQPDSVLLNRKNLISTTNWLVNVDKRLTLRQAIPHIKFLQSKKKSSSHKNEKAKNYFTCHDLSINNLGFIEFTDINYFQNQDSLFLHKANSKSIYASALGVDVKSMDEIAIHTNDSLKTLVSSYSNLIDDIHKSSVGAKKINLKIDGNITFQDYIYLKSSLLKLDSKSMSISKDELILN